MEGKIDLRDFKVLNQQKHDDFFLLHSTRLYPEWAFAKVEHTSDELADLVAAALLEMPKDSAAARAANIAGFAIPLDYQPVHELMKELRIGPYRAYGEITFGEAVKKYWYWIVLAIAAAVLLTFIKLNAELEQKVKKRTAELEKVNVELQREITERKRAEKRKLRLNRMFIMLSKINHAIIHVQNRQSLFEEACTIAVETGTFSMVWVGIIDEETRLLKPVASAGVVEGYLDNIQISVRTVQRDWLKALKFARGGILYATTSRRKIE